MRFFVRAKHWQLFGIMVLIPLLVQLIFFNSYNINLYFVIMSFVYMFLFVWILTTGILLNRKIPESVVMNINIFKFSVIIPLIYILLFFGLDGLFMDLSRLLPNTRIFIHFLSMFCIIYSFGFVAKSLKTVEKQSKVSFGEYIGDVFLLFFFPLGIWIIQPKINNIFKND